MSKAKFLGIPEGGKRAGWMEMEGGSGGGGALYVSFTEGSDGGMIATATIAEIQTALSEGKAVFAVIDDPGAGNSVYHNIASCSDNAAVFVVVAVAGATMAVIRQLSVAADGTVTMTQCALSS